MAAPILQTFPIGMHWPTIDPFLFVAHHHDDYPAGTDRLGPDASLAGREIGSDFAGRDGWNMYHGSVVPGFPQHPHRGFETITYVRRGLVDHADSMGATARYGDGDTQWLTAGGGMVHAEMFPLLHRDRPNPLELFQIWINLPRDQKFADPHFSMLWAEETPVVEHVDAAGRRTEVVVVAGTLEGRIPPPPPPASWASRPDSDVAVWHVSMAGEARWTLPAARPGTVRVVYVFEGDGVAVVAPGAGRIEGAHGAVVEAEQPLELVAGAGGTQFLVLQGRPIGEPVAQYGPFVMNDEAGIRQAFEDYRRTGFGGWPWDRDDPVHPATAGRFARYLDGRVEERLAG
jgi:redox-sensitive bicupin YhaK (pirin superfamily)